LVVIRRLFSNVYYGEILLNSMKIETKNKQFGKLTSLLGMASVDGNVALAASAGLFRPGNILLIAFLFLAGPAAILTASMLGGNASERMITALFAGGIATLAIVLAAGFGPSVLGFVNLGVLRVVGGIAVGLLALMIIGVKIPDKLPLVVMLVGIVLGGILR
jgi:hypothetical protein